MYIYLVVFFKIFLAAVICILLLLFSFFLLKRKKKAKPLYITIAVLLIIFYTMFYHGTIRSPQISENDILAFKEKLLSLDDDYFKEDTSYPKTLLGILSESHPELYDYFRSDDYERNEPEDEAEEKNDYSEYSKNFSNGNGIGGRIRIQKHEFFNLDTETVKAKQALGNVKDAELLPSQKKLFKSKIKSGETDGVKYMIAPLQSTWYGGESYDGIIWLSYETTTVYVYYSVSAKVPLLYFITHPKPLEWNLMDSLE